MLGRGRSNSRSSVQDKRKGNPILKLQLPHRQSTAKIKRSPRGSPSRLAEPNGGTKGSRNSYISNSSTLVVNSGSGTGIRLDARIDSLQSIPPPPPKKRTWKHNLPRWSRSMYWIRNNFDWNHLKPVLRSAVAAWISLLLLLIPGSLHMIGQGAFIVLLAAFLTPPADPFATVLERELLMIGTVLATFAWSCLGIRLAHVARENVDFNAETAVILTGRYVETAPTVICAFFLVFGSSVLLFIRTRIAQFPYTYAVTMAFICIDVALTAAPMFPYPYYDSGLSIVVPTMFHSLIALLTSLFVFPDSVAAQFSTRFHSALVPLVMAIRMQPSLLATPPNLMSDSEHEGPGAFRTLVQASEGALAPLASSGRRVKKSLIWSRFAPGDFGKMHDMLRRLTVRANGMAFYFKIMDPARHRFPGSPLPSPTKLTPTPIALSRQPSPLLPSSGEKSGKQKRYPGSVAARRPRRQQHYFSRSHGNLASTNRPPITISRPLFQPVPASLLQEALTRARDQSLSREDFENPVGVFESQRYLNLETRFAHPDADAVLGRMMALLNESVRDLVEACASAMEDVGLWLGEVEKEGGWKAWAASVMEAVRGGWTERRKERWEETVKMAEEARERLDKALHEFRTKKRHRVLELYRAAVDPKKNVDEAPPHRYLFQCYLYQYHLMQFALHLINILDEINRLEDTRRYHRFWLPAVPLVKFFSYGQFEPCDNIVERDEDEDPDVIPGMESNAEPSSSSSPPDPIIPNSLGFNAIGIGVPRRRDPDALPPSTWLETVGGVIYYVLSGLGKSNSVFAIKGGIMTAVLSLPSFLSRSAGFAFSNRFIWAIIMGQTTLSRFTGETSYGLISRILSTLFGGLVGAAMWYISAGGGDGNPYSLAAVAAVCFPVFFFARLYFPSPTMTVVIFFMTAQLVLGYSWQDAHLPPLSEAGKGIDVAWKRFTLVSIGVLAAFFFSFLPPATTLRRYLRTTYSTTAAEIGQLYCDVVSFASDRSRPENEKIVKNLMAIRMKLKRSMALRENVAYEISLRGKWPEERYKRVLDIQMEIAYLLSHLRSVVENLESSWCKAFLHRTHFLDSDFQGDVLAVISMVSTALRTGSPLPQVTPCPLLDRFTLHHQGLHVVNEDAEDDYGLPRTLTIETLEDEQYLCFCVGVATAFGIISRLDTLMLATKELVGEQYYIHGLMST